MFSLHISMSKFNKILQEEGGWVCAKSWNFHLAIVIIAATLFDLVDQFLNCLQPEKQSKCHILFYLHFNKIIQKILFVVRLLFSSKQLVIRWSAQRGMFVCVCIFVHPYLDSPHFSGGVLKLGVRSNSIVSKSKSICRLFAGDQAIRQSCWFWGADHRGGF